MIERRKGGETGVAAVQLIDGEEVWKAGDRRTLVSGIVRKRHFREVIHRAV